MTLEDKGEIGEGHLPTSITSSQHRHFDDQTTLTRIFQAKLNFLVDFTAMEGALKHLSVAEKRRDFSTQLKIWSQGGDQQQLLDKIAKRRATVEAAEGYRWMSPSTQDGQDRKLKEYRRVLTAVLLSDGVAGVMPYTDDADETGSANDHLIFPKGEDKLLE